MRWRGLAAAFAGSVVPVLAATACSDLDGLASWSVPVGTSSEDPAAARSVGSRGTGSVGFRLDLEPGAMLTMAQWVISNGTNTYSGVVTIADAQSLEFVQGNIAAGSGYTVALSATDTRGGTCEGTSPTFTVRAGAVVQTVLNVLCRTLPDSSIPDDVRTGTVEVDASVDFALGPATQCPGIKSFSINPAALDSNQVASLTLATVGPPSQIAWSVQPGAGGVFADAHAAATTFACANGAGRVPQVTITATLSLAGNSACDGRKFTATSAFVNCLGSD